MKDEFEKLLKQKMDIAYSEFLCRVVDFHEDDDVKFYEELYLCKRI